MRTEMLQLDNLTSRVSTFWSILVTSCSRLARFAFVPKICQSPDMKTTIAGAISSCSVHPRVCHRLLRNAEVLAASRLPLGTSARKA